LPISGKRNVWPAKKVFCLKISFQKLFRSKHDTAIS
jgi:hypothetical protein